MNRDAANVLVAEDDAEWRERLTASLEVAGYRVGSFSSGHEAVKSIGERPPDVAIVGLSLDLPAISIMQDLWEVNPDASVILTVGDVDWSLVVEALHEGALSYVSKPINVEEVQAMVHNAVRQQRLSMDHRGLVENLQLANRRLDEQIAERIRAEEQLSRSEELRRLQVAESARETERKRLAEELHDETMSSLAAMALEMGFLRHQAAQVSPELGDGLAEIVTRIKDTDKQLRHLVSGIFPSVLTDLGLVRAIRAYLDQLTARPIDNPCPLEIEFTSRGIESQRLPDEVEINIYRVVQQGVTNAIQHAEASRLLIDFALDDTGLLLSISDNGRGFDVNNPNETPQSGHFGLVNFRDRIAALNGTLELESRPSEGTTIKAKISTQLEPQADVDALIRVIEAVAKGDTVLDPAIAQQMAEAATDQPESQ